MAFDFVAVWRRTTVFFNSEFVLRGDKCQLQAKFLPM